MKTFLKDKHRMVSYTTIFTLLVIMTGISYYYLHFDSTSIAWTQCFADLFLTLSAIGVIIYGIFNKDKDKMLVGIEFLILSLIAMTGEILGLVKLSTLKNIFSMSAVALSVIFLFSMIDILVLGKRLISKWWFAILMVILAVVPTVASLIWLQRPILVTAYVIFAVLFAAATALAVMNIIKKKQLLFSWSYFCYGLVGLIAYVLRIFAINKPADSLNPVIDIIISFILIGAISLNYKEEAPKIKKIKHK